MAILTFSVPLPARVQGPAGRGTRLSSTMHEGSISDGIGRVSFNEILTELAVCAHHVETWSRLTSPFALVQKFAWALANILGHTAHVR